MRSPTDPFWSTGSPAESALCGVLARLGSAPAPESAAALVGRCATEEVDLRDVVDLAALDPQGWTGRAGWS